MFEYALVLLPVCLLACVSGALRLVAQRAAVAALILVLTTFAGLRGYVGTDTGAYHTMFERYATEDTLEVLGLVEPVFALLIKTVSLASSSGFAFIVAIAIVQAALLLAIIYRHPSPALFMAVYTSAFFLNFHFNILRASVAALLLLLAIDYLRASQTARFFLAGVLSVLSHFSSVLFFLPLTAVRRNLIGGVLLFAVISAATLAAVFLMVSDSKLLQYLTYLAVIDSGEDVQFGAGLFALFALYVVVYLCTVSRLNFKLLSALLLAWIVVRLLSTKFLFVDRIEVTLHLILLYLMIGTAPQARLKVARTTAIVALVALNLYGTLNGLEGSDRDSADGFDADQSRYRSTYLPYRFIWDED